ncbi:MAG: response regulator [Candidatus Accumulibacter sp.]|jgi:signal transduction histidine kinase/CheY-like chemotaxis protein|nr:response regulator [Accumulibacter sp.]
MFSIRLKIFGIIVAVVVAITGVSGCVGYLLTYQRVLSVIIDDANVLRGIASKLVAERVVELKEEAKSLANALREEPPEKRNAILRNNSRQFEYLSAAVFDKGIPVASYGEALPGEAHLSSEYARRALDGETVVATTEITASGLVMRVYTPLDGELLIMTLPGLIMSDLLSEFKFLETGNIFLADKSGVIVASVFDWAVMGRYNFIEAETENPKYKNMSAVLGRMIRGETGNGRYYFQGNERINAYAPVPGSDRWSLSVTIPLAETALVQTRRALLFTAAFILAFGIAGAAFASVLISRPFQTIEEQNESLYKLKRIAENASETKSNFIANTSHEMRTPLNAIIGLSELTLNSTENLPKAAFSNLEKIYSSGMNLLAIINDVLDISKVESGKFELVPVEYDLPSLINDTRNLNIMRIIEKPIAFDIEIDEHLPRSLLGDDLRIKQIFNNLLSNAFKYTREGQVLWRIGCLKEEDSIWLISSVQDTGIGIRQDDLNRIFSNYHQVDMKSNRQIEGTGLGLAIAKKLVEMMDGSISVESVYGKGSSFTVRIRQKLVTDAVIGQKTVRALKDSSYTSNKRVRNAKLMRAYIPYAKVLIVDDVETNLDVAKGILKPYGMYVDCARSGFEAVRLVREGKIRYDAIFMDHMMPEMNGVEAARIIREEIDGEYAKTVPIIALTANVIDGDEIFPKPEFQDVIQKPIDIYRMDSVINRWVRNRAIEETHPRKDSPPSALAGEARAPRRGEVFGIEGVEGIDGEKGLERFGGDGETYQNVLRSYLKHTARDLDKIRDPEALSDYSIVVHGIKGSSYAIEAGEVARMAQSLESAAKAGDSGFVRLNNPHFIELVENLLAELSSALSIATNGVRKEGRDAPDEALLEKMREASRDFRIDALERLMNELERFEYASGGDAVAALREYVDEMEFSKIRETLSLLQKPRSMKEGEAQ